MKQDYGANRELRRLLAERGMDVWELADRSGVHCGCLCRAGDPADPQRTGQG